MAKPKKIKTSRVSKPRKPKFKKVKNSFLQIGKTYTLHYSEKNGEHFLTLSPCILIDANENELLLKDSVNGNMNILLRKNIYRIIEAIPNVE
jgi:hypothetical protein